MKAFRFVTDLAAGSFRGTQMDIIPSGSSPSPRDIRLLLENESEVLVAYGDEIEPVEVEIENKRTPKRETEVNSHVVLEKVLLEETHR